jgi:hypothetical protein
MVDEEMVMAAAGRIIRIITSPKDRFNSYMEIIQVAANSVAEKALRIDS